MSTGFLQKQMGTLAIFWTHGNTAPGGKMQVPARAGKSGEVVW